jgi:glycosyltransferase involved in cell wall biosynthesis
VWNAGPIDFSVVVPAHNEERLLARSLQSIACAAQAADGQVEVIVVANRCTDATADIARAAGAVVVEHDARNLSAVRNAGAARARTAALVTIDADCRMSPRTFSEIGPRLRSGRCVGGGTRVVPERRSAGIVATYAVTNALVALTGLGGGQFWCLRSDFEAVGGFDESLLVAEDLDFARRLRAHGRRTGRKFVNLRTAPIVASCRKFDRFGDWHMFGMAFQARAIRAAMTGRDTAWADRYFFDFNP